MTIALERLKDQRRGFHNTSFRLIQSRRFSLKELSLFGWSLPSGSNGLASEVSILQFNGWSLDNESRRFDPSVWLRSTTGMHSVELLRVSYGIKYVWLWLQPLGGRVAKFKVILSAAERSVFLAWVRRFDLQSSSLASRLHCWLKAVPQR